MTRNEKLLVIGFVLVAGMTMLTSAVVAGGVLLYGTGVVSFERVDDKSSDNEAAVAMTSSATEATDDGATNESKDVKPAVAERLADRLKLRDLAGEAPKEARVLPAPGGDLGDDLSALYDSVNPGVVSILVEKATQAPAGAIPIPQAGVGSGWVYDEQHVVTNNHVVEGASDIEIVFFDGERRKADIVGLDVFSDLAVLRLESMPGSARILPIVDNFDALRVGEPVVAIGNPFNKSNSMSFGIVSALGRTMPDGMTKFAIPETIQTDAAINPGNSGGPLLNLRGEVIGVNAQINTTNFGAMGTPGNSGVGFAIPASVIEKVVPDLVVSGEYDWPYLGVSGGSISVDVAEANDLDSTKGAYISCVPTDGPSNAALEGADNVDCSTLGSPVSGSGVPEGGDVVVAIDGQTVTSFDDLLSYIALEAQPGETVRLTVLRDGRELDVDVRLGERPEPSGQ